MSTFIDYDKLSDHMCWLGAGAALKFNTILSKRDKDGNRRHFHREFSYESKYNNTGRVCSISREFNYYMSIESIYNRDAFIMIRLEDIMNFRLKLRRIIPWFDSKNYSIKNNRLVALGRQEPIIIENFNQGKWIKFEQVIVQYDGQFSPGVRMYLSSDEVFTDVSVDKFMAFVYLIETVDMFGYSQNQINYLQRPPYGTNQHICDKFSDEYSNLKGDSVNTKSVGRLIGGQKPPGLNDM